MGALFGACRLNSLMTSRRAFVLVELAVNELGVEEPRNSR